MEFRLLTAREIDCRVQQVKENGLSLLLYKDARCDQNILDETVGAMNWQRSHSRDNANCTVSIWDDTKKQWVSKEDTGTESNTEKEKGLASDSFKRACFNWGIGRELYSAPFIWITADKCKITNGKCYDRFKVSSIGYDAHRKINALTIVNTRTGQVVFQRGNGNPPAEDEKPAVQPPAKQDKPIAGICEVCGAGITDHVSKTGVVTPAHKVMEGSYRMFGKRLCGKCLLQANAQAVAAKIEPPEAAPEQTEIGA